MRYQLEKDTIGNAIAERYFELYDLSEQMQDSYDALPYQLQPSHRHREAAAAAMALTPPTVPKEFEDVQFSWRKTVKPSSRSLNRREQRDNIASCLRSCLFKLEDFPGSDIELDALKKELEEHIGRMESAEFRGMAT